jgi:ornithine cyclodeaminase/alanine dehydrogenase-like protein (mu-crystallin family)
MAIRFRILTESDVKSVLTMDDLIETMASALTSFSTKRVEQPVRAVLSVDGNHAFFGTMPAYVRATDSSGSNTGEVNRRGGGSSASLGAKLVTVFEQNHAKGLPSHLASILLLDPETGALKALLDGRYITEARTAAVSAVSSRLLARKTAKSLAIIGSGVQAKSHLEALSRVHSFKQVTVWSPNKAHREKFVTDCLGSDPIHRVRGQTPDISAVDHAGEAVVGADVIVLVTSSPDPVIESGWVKPGAHVISVGACRPNQREIDPALTARAKFFVDSRDAALIESGDLVMGIQEGRFGPDHVAGELGQLVAGTVDGRTNDTQVTIFKSLGMAVEDVMAADLAYRRAVEKNLGKEFQL